MINETCHLCISTGLRVWKSLVHWHCRLQWSDVGGSDETIHEHRCFTGYVVLVAEQIYILLLRFVGQVRKHINPYSVRRIFSPRRLAVRQVCFTGRVDDA